jgi:hypothetical protein
MASKKKPVKHSKLHLDEVENICGLRRSNKMSCCWCVYEKQDDCPAVRKRNGEELTSPELQNLLE